MAQKFRKHFIIQENQEMTLRQQHEGGILKPNFAIR